MTIKKMCVACGKKHLNIFPNGTSYCFTPECEYNRNKKLSAEFTELKLIDLSIRGISELIADAFGYYQTTHNGELTHAMLYGEAIKFRKMPKQFFWRDFAKDCQLFGMHLWDHNEHDSIVITEGEMDAMSIAQASDMKQAAVSLHGGAGSAKNLYDKNKEWLMQFKHIIICTDMDEEGRRAAKALEHQLQNDKVYVASLPLKDANEMLMSGRAAELLESIKVKEQRPEGLLFSNEINIDEYLVPEPRGIALPYSGLDDMTRGIQPGRFWTILAGTGVGKSAFVKELVYSLVKYGGLKVANIFLEEPQRHSILSYLALDNNIPFWKLNENPEIVLRRTLKQSAEALFTGGKLSFYNHFGSVDSSPLFKLLNYLAYVAKVNVIVLDHISIAISGLESSKEGERKDIDRLVTHLKTLVIKVGITLIVISHLKQPSEGKSFEEGRPVRISDIRSSGALGHLSDYVIGLQRNKHDDVRKNITTVNVLKNRYTGMTGLADTLYYMSDRGRLVNSNNPTGAENDYT